ncbi:UNVERIFIED_ORG: DNA-binding NtrC family response regulator [Methylorubrum zatmanii]|nr:DNA-binding NtrC family response regulator [Methylorubrum zatmanii]
MSSEPDGASERIVFIDDEEDVRRANRQSLELDGFQVETFEAGEPALAAIRAEPPGVVVTDVRLPGLDGRALLERIQARGPGPARDPHHRARRYLDGGRGDALGRL